ncbi:hypothetical protein RBH29_07365 [Herbivorax sp. ANBcel31]|uniref:hypothetical protein n=1 Tax=Herbivorax sp. ANBcel31 TaxID=3069754 RepID=UPI0027ADA897|nr:hypothetical protein [Herbivorax sp. ANBcel31]MDQ2086247.1 hypothetical protein [Herbivorax sp. ANBcel31]
MFQFLKQKVVKTVKKFIKIFTTLYNMILHNSTLQEKIETAMIVLVLLVLGLALADVWLVDNLQFSRFVEIFDFVVCAIFAVDLWFRYKRWKGSTISFFKTSWIEIIAIIPLDIVFRFFRIARLFRLVRLSRLSKLGRFGNTFMKLIRMAEMSFTKGGSYFRFKRFKKLLFGYGKSKSSEETPKEKTLTKEKDIDSTK